MFSIFDIEVMNVTKLQIKQENKVIKIIPDYQPSSALTFKLGVSATSCSTVG